MRSTDLQLTELATRRDDELLVLIVRRHEPALGALYDRYGRLIFTIALRITGDRATAEEVVQDVFQSIWLSAGSFQPGLASFTSWLFGITRHRAIDTLRSKRERARGREQVLDDSSPALGATNADQVIEQALLRDAVRQALDELPAAQRQAIELAYYGGLSGAEIAERTGEPLGTIKTRMRLALTKLRTALRGYAGEEG